MAVASVYLVSAADGLLEGARVHRCQKESLFDKVYSHITVLGSMLF